MKLVNKFFDDKELIKTKLLLLAVVFLAASV